jgi:hypothetical protein
LISVYFILAIERAMAYLDTGDLPWDMDLLDSQDVNHVSVFFLFVVVNHLSDCQALQMKK